MLFRFLFLGLMLFVFYWGTSSFDGPDLSRPGAETRADSFELPVRYRLGDRSAGMPIGTLAHANARGSHGLVKPTERTYR